MTTELTTYQQPQTALTIGDEQHTFTDMQVQALSHIGVQNAAQGDLAVFFHVVKRTGLDPFARQIYMIGRVSSENVDGTWVKTTKQTIQTGIDGYRLIGRRAAARSRDSIAVGAPEWAHEDGSWRPVWRKVWGNPIAARVTIHRAGEPFTAVALFDEYAQTKRNGDLTQMWSQRPAGQVAKCAEALAWRMAFPQDLSDVYTDEEMQHADVADVGRAPVAAGRAAVAAAVAPAPQDATGDQIEAIRTHMDRIGMAPGDLLRLASSSVGRVIGHPSELTVTEADSLIGHLATMTGKTVGGELAAEPEPAAATDAGLDAVTTKQVAAINIALTARGIGTKGSADAKRAERHSWLSEATGRAITSSKDLTKAEAGTLLDHFAAEDAKKEQEPEGDESFPNDTLPAA